MKELRTITLNDVPSLDIATERVINYCNKVYHSFTIKFISFDVESDWRENVLFNYMFEINGEKK